MGGGTKEPVVDADEEGRGATRAGCVREYLRPQEAMVGPFRQ